MESDIQVVVFDMGGVVVRLRPLAELLDGTNVPETQLWERWILSSAVKDYEAGGCSLENFSERVVEELGVAMTPSAFIDRFRAFPMGLFDGALELLDETRNNVPIAILSNTNELHWSTQPDGDWLRSAFDHEYLSYRLGLVKPSHAIFDHVASDLGVAPSSLLFLDDNQINVDGARQAGWQAEIAKGPHEARSVLVDMGVL